MRHVYVAGPYTAPTPEGVVRNVEVAIDAANRLLDAGLWPYVPHLSHYLHARKARDYEAWLGLDLAVLGRMDALLRLPGESRGADREVFHMTEVLARPVFTCEYDLYAWAHDGCITASECRARLRELGEAFTSRVVGPR